MTDDPSFFTYLSETSSDCVWLVSKYWGVVYCNAAARHIHSVDDPLEKDWLSLWPSTYRFSLERLLNDARQGREGRVRMHLSGPNGDTYLRFKGVAFSSIDAPDGILVRAENVTTEVEASALLRTIIDALPAGIAVQDAHTGRYMLSNPAADVMFDKVDGLVGLSPTEALPAEVAEWSRQEADRRPAPRRAILQDAVGERWLSITQVTTYDDGGERHIVELVEDATQRRRDEETLRNALKAAETAEQARTAFLGNISHEIRTPLNGVIAGLDLLQGPDGGIRDEVMDMMRTSARRLERRLEDLIRVVEPDVSAAMPVLRPFRAEDLLGDLASRYAALAAVRGLTVETKACGVPELLGDAAAIEDALCRLIDNAVKFSDAGGIELSCSTTTPGRVRFTVADRGVGFPPEAKTRLFQGLAQGNDTLTRRHGGLGVGLAVAARIARRLGGEIDAAPREGGGSEFWLEAPLARHQPPAEIEADEDARAPIILVVDDHATNRRMVELMLDGWAEVACAEDGIQGVEAAAARRFDLILMDVQMPNMDGISAVARIRQNEILSGLRATPIIMLTANTQTDIMLAARAAGADRQVGKPFTASVLLSAIQAALADVDAVASA